MTSWRAYVAGASSALALSVALVLLPASPAAAFDPSGPGGAIQPTDPAGDGSGAVDRTVTSEAKTSAAYRKTVQQPEWLGSDHAVYVINKESHGNCKAVSPTGAYRGKWQMSQSLWDAFSPSTYPARADLASCAQQDLVAYRVWLASWWTPWGG